MPRSVPPRRPLFSAVILLAVYCQSLAADPPATNPVTGLARNIPDVFVLSGARIFVAPDHVIESGTLVVRDGHVAAVGRDVDHIAAARQLDMSGKTIYAGLIDGFTEVDAGKTETGARHWNPGVTPQRSAADSYKVDDKLNKQLREQGIVARLAVPRGGQIKGTSVLVSTGEGAPDRGELRRDVALHVSLTTTRSRGQYPGSPMGAVALVRQSLHDAKWYGAAWATYNQQQHVDRPEQNAALAALHEFVAAKMPIVVDAGNERYFLRAERLAQEFNLDILIRGSGREYRRPAAIAKTGRPVLLPVDFPKAPNVASPEAALNTSLQQLMHWDLAPENPGRLVAAGVTVALTSDGLEDKAAFLKSVRAAVRRGLDPPDALAALTVNPAQLFGIADRLGTLDAGKLASFVITDGDLFEKKTKIIETWVGGQRHKIETPTEVDPRGSWRLRFPDLVARPKRAKLEIKGDDADKLKGTIEARGESYDLKKTQRSDVTFSCTFPATAWKQEGVAQVSFVVTAAALAGKPTSGRLALPDGTESVCVAIKQEQDADASKDEKEESPDENKPNEEQKSDDEEKSEQMGEQTKSSDDPDGGNDAGEDKSAENEEDNGDDEGEDEEAEDKAPVEALYAVNFPLGAFGRETLPTAETVMLVGATIWTCGPDGKLGNASLLVRDGKIVSVGKDLAVPDGVPVIDLAGKHVTPGIIDCHSHIATDGGVNEPTQAITAEVRIGDFVDPDDISIYRQLAGGVTSSNILHGSANPIGGQNQVIKMRWGALPEQLKFAGAPPGIKFALGENVKQSNWGAGHTTRYPQTRMGVDEIIADALERAKAYSQSWQEWRASKQGLPPRVDLELEALAEVVAGKRWIHCHSYRQSEILALMRTCDRFGITIGSLQHILEGYKLADEMAKRGVTGSAFSDWWAYKFEVYDAIPYNGALMHKAGVIVSFNSDDAELGRRLNLEAAKAIKYGSVPAVEAMKFVTLNPAKQLRIDDRVGSLEAGKDADFAVWSGPPMSVYSRCLQTWIDGRRYFDEQEDRRLRERDRQRHTALVQRILSSDAEMLGPDDDDRDENELWPRHDEFCHLHGDEHFHDDE